MYAKISYRSHTLDTQNINKITNIVHKPNCVRSLCHSDAVDVRCDVFKECCAFEKKLMRKKWLRAIQSLFIMYEHEKWWNVRLKLNISKCWCAHERAFFSFFWNVCLVKWAKLVCNAWKLRICLNIYDIFFFVSRWNINDVNEVYVPSFSYFRCTPKSCFII